MIGLERPLLLGLLGVIVPWLWFLERRLRRRRQTTVSSLQIWRRVLATAEAPVRKRRITSRLLLAMAASVGMVGAAVGPYCDPGTGLSRELTVLIDRRPGMGARGTDGRTRLAVGIATLLQGLEQQPSPVRIRLLTVPAMPAVCLPCRRETSGASLMSRSGRCNFDPWPRQRDRAILLRPWPAWARFPDRGWW